MKIFLRSAVSAATLAVLIDREQSRGEGVSERGREERTRWKVAPKKELFWETEKTQVAPVIRDSFFLIGMTECLRGAFDNGW